MKTHWPRLGQAGDLTTHIASTPQELLPALRLVYETYRAKGYIEAHPAQMVYDETFARPTTRTIVCRQGQQVSGTLTVVGDCREGILAERVYPTEIQSLRAKGRRLAEISSLAVRADGAGRGGDAFFACTQMMIQYAYHRQYDDLIMVFHPRKMKFYWRWFRVFPIGASRPYDSLPGSPPGVCCRIDLRTLWRNADPELLSLYFAREFPPAVLDGPGISPSDHRWLCGLRGIAVNDDYEVCGTLRAG